MLERTLAEARRELRVIDVVADPGMGKSRLLHEFRQLIGEEQAFILTEAARPTASRPRSCPSSRWSVARFRFIGRRREQGRAQARDGNHELGLHSWKISDCCSICSA